MYSVVMVVCLFFSFAAYTAHRPVGFLWYNLEKTSVEAHTKGVSFRSLSATKRDAVLHFYTLEALHRAHFTHKMQDMRTFLRLQDYWLRESSQFNALFQKTMLYYPELDYGVMHPTSAIGSQLMDARRDKRYQKMMHKLAKDHGLLFFYRGKNAFDQRQVAIVHDFCRRFALTLIPVSVDGKRALQFPHSRLDKGQAQALKVHYFPALLLVSPKKRRVLPVAYGFTTQDVLVEKIVNTARTLH